MANPASAAPSVGDRRIVVSGLSRRFGSQIALHPLSLEIEPGRITGLLGPNGSGKSTFMRLLTGLVRPDAGSATVDGTPLEGDGTAIRRRVTYAPGELHLYGEMRGAEHLEWLLRGRDAEARARALRMAKELELPLVKRVRTYSHGMKRQLLFAAALAPRVGVRILDEATEGLDPSRRGEMLDLLARDAAAGTTVLLSSHHLGEVDRACDRLLFMSQGRLIGDESSESVRARARRIVHIVWESAAELGAVDQKLSLPGVESVRRDANSVSVFLASDDPRGFLRALATLDDLPPPLSVEHGRLSLPTIYRELYGVEGC